MPTFVLRARLAVGDVPEMPWLQYRRDQTVPYLQLDVPNHYPVDVKRYLDRRLGDIYARSMQTTPDPITVAFREWGEGGRVVLNSPVLRDPYYGCAACAQNALCQGSAR
jgi:hypothetical protein